MVSANPVVPQKERTLHRHFEATGTSSRIDMAFGNPEAVRLFKTFEVLDVPSHGVKSHKLVKVVLDVKCPKSYAWQTRQVKKLPVPEEAL